MKYAPPPTHSRRFTSLPIFCRSRRKPSPWYRATPARPARSCTTRRAATLCCRGMVRCRPPTTRPPILTRRTHRSPQVRQLRVVVVVVVFCVFFLCGISEVRVYMYVDLMYRNHEYHSRISAPVVVAFHEFFAPRRIPFLAASATVSSKPYTAVFVFLLVSQPVLTYPTVFLSPLYCCCRRDATAGRIAVPRCAAQVDG